VCVLEVISQERAEKVFTSLSLQTSRLYPSTIWLGKHFYDKY